MHHHALHFFKIRYYILLPLLSGLILIFSFPPFNLGFLPWAALLPFLDVCLKEKPRRAFWAGIFFGLPLNLYLNLYLAEVLFPYLPTYLALAAMIALVIYISLFNALFAFGVSMVSQLKIYWFTVTAIPALWLLVEYMRSLSFLAYNVGYLGYTQWGYPFILNLAASYGYWGLPFVIVFGQSIALLAYRRELIKTSLAAIVAIFIVISGTGLLTPTLTAVEEPHSALSVGLIQGNRAVGLAPGSLDKTAIMNKHIELTERAAAEAPGLDLVVWPETVVDLIIKEQAAHRQPMIDIAAENDLKIIYGAQVRDSSRLYNSITLLSPGEESVPLYHKQRLVPFVEYFPFEEVLNRILRLDLLLGSYSAGEDIKLFHVGQAPLAGVICFESYFGDYTRRFTAKGSKHLFVLTNDAWFGKTIGLDQHANAAAIRAAEMGVGVTQVANSGITVSFDYRGKELLRSEKAVADFFVLTLDLKKRATLYTRFGDYFPALWIAYLFITGLFLFSRRRP